MKSDLPELFEVEPTKLLEYLFDRLPVGTAVIDRDFRLRRCNPTWAEFIDRYTLSSADEVVPGVSLFDIEPGTEDVLKPLFAPVFAGETVRQEGVCLESGGIISYWDVVLVPLEVDGQVVAALDVSLDATHHVLDQLALQNTLNALRESETNLRSMLENAKGYAIYRITVDPNHPYLGRVVLISPSIRDVIGIEDPYDFSEWFSGVHPDDLDRVVAANQRAIEQGLPFEEEMRFFHKQREEWRWVQTVSNPVFDETGRVTHYNGITIDITPQKEAQETLAQINRVLEEQVAQRTQEIEKRHQELEALYKADRQLLQYLDLDAILHSLVEIAVDVLHADKSSLMAWNDKHERLEVCAAYGFHPDTLEMMKFSPGEGTVGHVAVTGETAVVENIDQDERVLTQITDAEGIRSFMHFPIMVGNRIFGVFNVDYTSPRTFSLEEQRLFEALTKRAALAIGNAQLYREERKRHRESERRRQVAESLRGIVRILNSSKPLPEILDHIAAEASQLVGAACCMLNQIDIMKGEVHVEASYGLPEPIRNINSYPLDSSKVDLAILNRKPVVLSADVPRIQESSLEAATDTRVRRFQEALQKEYPAYLAVPLIVENDLYGSLAFYFTNPRSFDKDTLDLATSLGEQAALAIDNARLKMEVERTAIISERNRLARELHDAVTQTLFSATLIAEVLPRIWEQNTEVGHQKLEELRELTRGALAEMRTLLLELRPATLTESSLGELLQQLAEAVIGRSRLQVNVEIEDEKPLPPEIQVALYRIAQEALNNVIKHSGATEADVCLTYHSDAVELKVVDNGRGFDPTAVSVNSLGLGIMRERASTINADFRVDSNLGEGTTVSVTALI